MIQAMIEIKGIDPKMIANNIEPFEPTHPGELLRDEIEYRHISQKQLAADMGVSYTVTPSLLFCARQHWAFRRISFSDFSRTMICRQ